MNKKALIGTGIIIIVLVILGINIFGSKKSTNIAPASSPVAQTPQNQNLKSLKDLLASGQPVKCSFKDPESGEGIIFVTKGKARSDFSSVSGSSAFKAHMLVLDQTSYIWTEGSSTGLKTSLEAKQATSSGQTSSSMDSDKKMDFSCAAWTVDNAVFSLPKDVKFTEISQEGITGPNNKTSQCASCDSLPETAKVQCKSALGC